MDLVSVDVPSSFESERFVLRSYGPGDGAMYYAAGLRNREHLARYEAVNVILAPKSEADAEKLVRELGRSGRRGGRFSWGYSKRSRGHGWVSSTSE